MTKPDISTLPDHTKELKHITNLVKKAYANLINDLTNNRVTVLKRKTYKYIFESYLYEVADLSLTRNEIRDDLQKYYDKQYSEGHVLGTKLYYQEYFELHKEYDKVKKQIWKAIFKVDDEKIIRPDILI
jgi:hypothetical protein